MKYFIGKEIHLMHVFSLLECYKALNILSSTLSSLSPSPSLQYLHTSSPPTITCALYLTSVGRLVCGQADGSIAVLSATQAATVLMLQPRKFSRGVWTSVHVCMVYCASSKKLALLIIQHHLPNDLKWPLSFANV